MIAPTPTPPPLCPRCEYDLRGDIETWHDSCPVSGLCPECGLVFHWSDVLIPERRLSPGLVEHATSRGESLRWTFTTWLWAFVPLILWGKVKLHHDFSPRRALRGVATALLCVYLANAGAEALMLASTGLGAPTSLASARFGIGIMAARDERLMLLNPLLGALIRFEWVAIWRGTTPTTTLVAINYIPQTLRTVGLYVIASLAWPALFLILPQSRLRGNLAYPHFARALIYSLWAFPAMGSLYVALKLAFVALSLFQPVYFFYPSAIFSLLAPWHALFWMGALIRGWKLHAAFVQWLLLQFAVALFVAVVIAYGRHIF